MTKLVLCCTIVCGSYNFYKEVNQQSHFPKPSKCTGALHQYSVPRIVFFTNKTIYLKTSDTHMCIDLITTYRYVVHMAVIVIFLLKMFKDIFLVNKSRSVLRWMRAYDVQGTFWRPTSLDFTEFRCRLQAWDRVISFFFV